MKSGHHGGLTRSALAACLLQLALPLPVLGNEDTARAVERCRASAWLSSSGVGEADVFVDWGTGLRVCEEALALVPEDPVALAAYGRALYKTEQYPKALEAMRRAAAGGHPYGQFGMGDLCDFGYGMAQDHVEAVAWYRKAAEQGYAPAQSNLGAKYEHGEGVDQDNAQAVAWYRKAAEQGYAKAQFNLGEMYENGRGVPQDLVKALFWYRRADAQGHADAFHRLGWFCLLRPREAADGEEAFEPQSAAEQCLASAWFTEDHEIFAHY